jgi:hypothetical protein
MRRIICLAVGAWLGGALVAAGTARAHISIEQGGTHLSRYGDTELKAGPCGVANGKRGTHIYTYEPGQTITLSLVEYIAHPGYFRIAFDADGDDDFKEPASILPVDPNRACPDDPGDHCGQSDFYNNAAVLPGMDNLNPHVPSGGQPKYTWQVKLPNVECTNCTLQVIQVMEDDAAHGPYDPTPGVGVEDIYHQCIDLVLKKGASTAPDGGAAGSGGAGGGSGNNGGSHGGCAIAGPGSAAAPGGLALLLLLAGIGGMARLIRYSPRDVPAGRSADAHTRSRDRRRLS